MPTKDPSCLLEMCQASLRYTDSDHKTQVQLAMENRLIDCSLGPPCYSFYLNTKLREKTPIITLVMEASEKLKDRLCFPSCLNMS